MHVLRNYLNAENFLGSSFLPVPASFVFPATGNGFDVDQPATFTVDFDDNTGSSDTSSSGAGSAGIDDDGEENDSAFGGGVFTFNSAEQGFDKISRDICFITQSWVCEFAGFGIGLGYYKLFGNK